MSERVTLTITVERLDDGRHLAVLEEFGGAYAPTEDEAIVALLGLRRRLLDWRAEHPWPEQFKR